MEKKMRQKTESEIEAWLSSQIKLLGGLSCKWVAPGLPGVPDRIYILPGGRIVFAELKTNIGRVSNIQRWFHQELRIRGAEVRVIRGFEEAKEFIAEMKEGGKENAVPTP